VSRSTLHLSSVTGSQFNFLIASFASPDCDADESTPRGCSSDLEAVLDSFSDYFLALELSRLPLKTLFVCSDPILAVFNDLTPPFVERTFEECAPTIFGTSLVLFRHSFLRRLLTDPPRFFPVYSRPFHFIVLTIPFSTIFQAWTQKRCLNFEIWDCVRATRTTRASFQLRCSKDFPSHFHPNAGACSFVPIFRELFSSFGGAPHFVRRCCFHCSVFSMFHARRPMPSDYAERSSVRPRHTDLPRVYAQRVHDFAGVAPTFSRPSDHH
jgi:hypothetical protein